jgi:hypothetical protein
METQNRKQRGFFSGSQPINSALPVAECYREVVDNNTEGQVILLDAKAAFDKVIHSHRERRVYQAGIDDKHWVLIKSLHENAESSIKWAGSPTFSVSGTFPCLKISFVITRSRFSISLPTLSICSIVRPW